MANVTYFAVTDFIAGQGITLRSAASPQFVQNRLDAALAYVSRATGVEYGSDSVSATRYYDGNGYDELAIEPAISVSTVRHMSNGTAVYTYVMNTDYAVYPLNDTPKTSIKRISAIILSTAESNLAYQGSWPAGERNIEVDGVWGGAATMPADLAEAVLMKATLLVLAGDNLPLVGGALQGAVKSYDVGAYSVTYAEGAKQNVVETLTGWDALAEKIINGYKVFRAW
jgi:hypothetical protein